MSEAVPTCYNSGVSDPDVELIALARGGDEGARAALMERLEPVVRNYLERGAGARLRRFTSVEDLIQDVFTRGFRALDRLPASAGVDDFRGLLLKNAGWVLMDHGRRAGDFVGESVFAGEEAPGPGRPSSGTVTRRDEARWVRELVCALDEKYASVLQLYLDGHSTHEIARTLGIQEETARKRLLRATARLRARQGDRDPGDR